MSRHRISYSVFRILYSALRKPLIKLRVSASPCEITAVIPRAAFRIPQSLLLLFALSLCGLVAGGSGLVAPIATSQAQAQSGFADPAFKITWDRTDGPVASGAVKRPWVWGPVPGVSVQEVFGGLPGNTHLVQYFDKGRMELNNPAGDKNDPFYVTNGLLAVELISGQLQTGTNTFENRGPSTADLASDADDPTAPTYQSFNGVANVPGAPNERRKSDLTGQTVRTAIDRQGNTQPWPADHLDYGVHLVHFEPATGHNIPDVFWDYLNQQTDIIQGGKLVKGPLFYPWFVVTGYPISEPYWAYVKVEGKYTDVLIQAFERRVLTFIPHLPSPFKVQIGNIGQHYYDWRHGKGGGGGPQRTPVATPTKAGGPPPAKLSIDAIDYRTSLVDLNGTSCTITNQGDAAQRLDGWWLDSPKWDHVDRFYFPNGIIVQPGASIKVHSGTGNDTATDVYMFRTTVMWDGALYDLAVLYDNAGREVARLFPAAEVGVPPTPPAPNSTPPAKGTPAPSPTGATATATRSVPSPQPSSQATIGSTTATLTVTARGTATVTVTGTITGTVTTTVTVTVPGTRTPSPTATTPGAR